MRRFSTVSTLQFLSDVHLEYKNKIPTIHPKATYLALLGDIGNPFRKNYKIFLGQASDKFEKTFIISGNHEYWNTTSISDTDNKISQIAENFPNVYYLNNNSHLINDYMILGTTLWTNIINKNRLGDNTKIIYDKKLLTDNNINTLHNNSVKWLKDQISKHKNIIVLTHHLPSFKLIIPRFHKPRYINVHDRFASDLDYLITKPVVAWLCGHSHCQTDTYINGIYCGINAVGYRNNEIRSKVIDLH